MTVVAVVAHAAGFAPIAGSDQISVARGRTVTRLANGGTSVLANDLDLEGDTMTAMLVENPKRGSLALKADGTFIYVHDGSAPRTDQFRYRASDGTRTSLIANVNIEIMDPGVAPQIVGQRKLSLPEDSSLQITLQDLVVQDPDSRFPQEFTLSIETGANFTVQGARVRPANNFNGTLSVPIQVNDGQSNSNVFNAVITVTAVNDQPIVAQPLGNREAIEGQPFQLEAASAFSDGDAGDTMTFTATGLPASRSLTLNTASGVLSGTPLAADVRAQAYTVAITARDAAGASVSSTLRLTVTAAKADLALSAKVDPNPATYQVAPTWTLQVENRGSTASAASQLRAEWFSSGPALTLSAPAGCNATGNGTAHVDVQCSFGGIAAFQSATIVAQTTQQSPGDVVLLAQLAAADGDAANNRAIANLNLAGSFGAAPAQLLAARSTDLAVGDIDADDLPDVVAVGDEVKIFYNSGEDDFIAGPALGAASAGTTLALIDWNLDRLLDIAVFDRGAGAGRVFLNAGQAGFTQSVVLPVTAIDAAAAADLDGDGAAELVVAGDAGTMRISRNATVSVLHSAAARHVAAADLNSDGRADVVITDAATRAVYVLLSSGAGYTTSTASSTGSTASVALGDVDGDAALDLLLAIDGDNLQRPANVILRNAGNGVFTARPGFGASRTRQLLAADLDRDGIADIGVINLSGTHQFYRQTDQGELALQSEFILSPRAQRAVLTDLDGDLYPDLLLGGEGSATIEFYRNNGAGRFGGGDVTAPVITLVGAASVTVQAGDAYADPGATAQDDVQGDVTALIVVDDPVVPTIVGTYAVRYNVTDRAGNRAQQVERTVIVEPKVEGGGGGGSFGYLALALLASLAALRRRSNKQRLGFAHHSRSKDAV